MALAKLRTFALAGIEAVPVEAEVDVASSGLPAVVLVGLAETAVKESVHRVERAILNSGYSRATTRVVINLAPGDLRKDAAAFDLPIALGLLAGTGQLDHSALPNYIVAGELALDGSTRKIKGALSMAIAAAKLGYKRMIVPTENAKEAAVVDDIDVFPVGSLSEAVGLISGEVDRDPQTVDIEELFRQDSVYDVDFADVRGQETAKRAMVLAAAGRHNVILIGPPGTGKTMLAKRLPTILPSVNLQEAVEITKIYSSIGLVASDRPLRATRPFRTPHHTASEAGLIGGGTNPTPGEVSLAHLGVLFLDELPEFTRRTLEVMRQPLEDRTITVTRANAKVTFPADFLLVAAMNPCPCGYLTDSRRKCNCTPLMIERYLGKISGPLLDRIDVHLEVPSVPFEELRGRGTGTSSEELRKQVLTARTVQQERFRGLSIGFNGQMSGKQIREFCPIGKDAEAMLKQAVDELGLSIRAHDRVLRVSRTIADLSGSKNIEPFHLAEAIQFRHLDRKIWA